jgi:hypothetical protein
MRSARNIAGLVPQLSAAALLALGTIVASRPAEAACSLHSKSGAITRVVQIQFDNLHLRRDNPNVPSDLEQMPHLLNFLSDGILSTSHQGSPLARKAPDSITVLTGLYGDRTGVPIADTYGTFRADGSTGFTSAFGYWTATGGDGEPLLLSETGKTLPAPWVPLTRAGCDVGAVATAGLAPEGLATDIANVFGATSPEAAAAASDPAGASAELLGVAIHCARGSELCANAHARSDRLPDEPGGYAGFNALFGHRHVQPVISPGAPVSDIEGRIIADSAGHPGLPSAFELSAAQSLGYAATMLEAGVSIVYAAIGDAHARPAAAGPRASGPGEADHVARLAADDAAFEAFIDQLAADGITKRNTLFVVVSTGNDTFVGAPPNPPDCNGISEACSYAPVGRIETSLNRLLATERHNVTAFDVVPGNAPAFFVRSNPLSTDPLARTLQQDVSKLTVVNPITGKADRLTALLADRAEMQLMHMIPASAARAPNFIMFGDAAYFNKTTADNADCALPPACAAIHADFPWASADILSAGGNSWFAMTGPGVAHLGQTTDLPSHHADIRPTMLAFIGLADSYVHDGVVLAQTFDERALALAGSRDAFVALARAYETLNDPVGRLARESLVYATEAIKGTDTGYERYLTAMSMITAKRDALAGEMKVLLDGAAFAHRPIDPADAGALAASADALVGEVEDLAAGSIGHADRPWKAATGDH